MVVVGFVVRVTLAREPQGNKGLTIEICLWVNVLEELHFRQVTSPNRLYLFFKFMSYISTKTNRSLM